MADAASRTPVAVIANHQEWSARSLESILGPSGYAVLRAYSGQQVLDQMRGANPDLYLLDTSLPDMHGVELCRTLRADPHVTATTPILLTTAGPSTREQRLEGLRAGAWDFLGLPLDSEELLLRLDAYVKAKMEADSVRDEGLLDHLTGLYNIRGLLRRARELGSDASRHQRALACIVFSPELASEQAPTTEAVAEDEDSTAMSRLVGVFKATGRVSDAIGRLGQNEFVVLAPDTDPAGALRLAERLTTAAESGGVDVDKPTSRVRLRAGYYAVPNFQEASIEPVEMLVRATMALRSSQASPGGERIHFFDRDLPSMS
jgi:diguanylate cyclase (GGDEF)-like protein